MNQEQYQKHIQDNISKDLYIEPTQFDDIARVMYRTKVKGIDKNLYVCAFPARGIREEFDKNYQSDRGDAFPSREMRDAKIRNFIDQLPANIDLYE